MAFQYEFLSMDSSITAEVDSREMQNIQISEILKQAEYQGNTMYIRHVHDEACYEATAKIA